MTTEQWKPIPDFDGYEVSDLGRVRSLTRVIVCKTGIAKTWPGRAVTPGLDPNGRLWVRLYRDRVPNTRRVHRLVIETFVGPPAEGMECCHNDGDETNNALTNLRWDTRSANIRDQIRHGVHSQSSKTHCRRGHAFEGNNVAVSTTRTGQRRTCRTCHRDVSRERMRLAYVAHPRPPRVSTADRARMVQMRQAGVLLREIAETFGISESTAHRNLARAQRELQETA